MLTLTITLQDTAHQIVLAFDTRTALDHGLKQTWDTNGPNAGSLRVMIQDDYGQVADISPRDIISTVVSDLDKHWEYRNAVSIAKLRAEASFHRELQNDPTLSFLVNAARAEFGSK